MGEKAKGGCHMDNGASSYRRFLAGDESAFEEILETYREGLTFFINRYVCDEAAAEDIAIDVFTYILLHKHRYNFKTSLKTYLYMLGRSRALDYLRKRTRLVFSELEKAGAQAPPPEEQIFRGEREKMVRDAVAKLPRDMREAVELVYFEGLSYEETAKIMKKTKKQVDNTLYRAKEKLRDIIGKDGELWL